MDTIHSGSFEMGSTERENVQPMHNVNISQFAEATNYPVPTECRHEMDSCSYLYFFHSCTFFAHCLVMLWCYFHCMFRNEEFIVS